MLALARILKFAFQDFWRNIWLSLVTITVLVLALFTVNILLGLNAVSESFIDTFEQKVDINIVMTPEASEAQINNFVIFLSNIEQVKSVEYKSKEQVLEEFKQNNSDDQSVQSALQEVEDNPFNDTVIVQANDISEYGLIIDKILQSEYETIVNDQEDFADPQKVISIVQDSTAKVQKVGFVLTGIFSIIALLIVFNTIRVIIYTHKEEIGVMRLVGATSWFIRTPYLMEAMIYALISVLVQIGLLYTALYFAQPYFTSLLGYSNFDLIAFFHQNFIQIFGVQLLATAVLTMFSSGIAIRKYLKV